MRTEVYWIDGVPSGKLGIASRPRGGEWLDDEIEAWRKLGVDFVVSALTPAEEAELDLEQERAVCRRRGLQFASLPIPDRGTPGTPSALRRVLGLIVKDLKSGGTVLVHCRQGIGRASLIAATTLGASGETPDQAFSRIERARGRPVPDTGEQKEWVRRFVAGLRNDQDYRS
jgi:protein-tyrosine phosphatase